MFYSFTQVVTCSLCIAEMSVDARKQLVVKLIVRWVVLIARIIAQRCGKLYDRFRAQIDTLNGCGGREQL